MQLNKYREELKKIFNQYEDIYEATDIIKKNTDYHNILKAAFIDVFNYNVHIGSSHFFTTFSDINSFNDLLKIDNELLVDLLNLAFFIYDNNEIYYFVSPNKLYEITECEKNLNYETLNSDAYEIFFNIYFQDTEYLSYKLNQEIFKFQGKIKLEDNEDIIQYFKNKKNFDIIKEKNFDSEEEEFKFNFNLEKQFTNYNFFKYFPTNINIFNFTNETLDQYFKNKYNLNLSYIIDKTDANFEIMYESFYALYIDMYSKEQIHTYKQFESAKNIFLEISNNEEIYENLLNEEINLFDVFMYLLSASDIKEILDTYVDNAVKNVYNFYYSRYIENKELFQEQFKDILNTIRINLKDEEYEYKNLKILLNDYDDFFAIDYLFMLNKCEQTIDILKAYYLKFNNKKENTKQK